MDSIEALQQYDPRSGKSSPVNAAARAIRVATLADAEAVVALVERAYRGDGSRAGWTTEADLLDGQRTDLDDVRAAIAEHTMLLVEHGERLIASVLLKAQADTVLLGMFAVDPTLQGSGLGRFVLDHAEAEMRTRFNATRGRMTVLAQRHELIDWYTRRGWTLTGAREPFPYGNPRFGLPKRDDLEFLVLEKQLG